MKSSLAAALLALTLAACASAPSVQVADADTAVCATETPTGTHMPRKICKSLAEREQERRAAEEGLAGLRGGKPEPMGR